jgi:hypothetical protein
VAAGAGGSARHRGIVQGDGAHAFEPGGGGEEGRRRDRGDRLDRQGAAAPAAAPAPAPAPTVTSFWGVVWEGGKNVITAASQVMVVVFLVFFMLASGDLFKRKVVKIAGKTLSEKKITVEMIDEIDLQIRATSAWW